MIDASRLRTLIPCGGRVAFGDGAGSPVDALPAVAEISAQTGDVELLLGWVVEPLDLDVAGFRAVRALMGGHGLRRAIDAGDVRYTPARLGTVPSLLRGPLRPDVLVASVRRHADGYRFTSEVAWQRAAIDAGAVVAAIERPASPAADAGAPLPADSVVVVGSSPAPPIDVLYGRPQEEHRAIAAHVVTLLGEETRLQFGPGPLATAVLEALTIPVYLDSGILTDAVVELDRRGLLASEPLATYLTGTTVLYEWAEGRPLLDRVERTHDPCRRGATAPFVALNTALEIDLDGQVNVESVGGSAVAGVGGHPDYAFAAARALNGLSVIAVPTRRGAHATLVEQLSAPVSTPAHDVDVVVTEFGVADLRGLDRGERRAALAELWNAP